MLRGALAMQVHQEKRESGSLYLFVYEKKINVKNESNDNEEGEVENE